MYKICTLYIVLGLMIASSSCTNEHTSEAEHIPFVDDLMSRMTVQEKVGQTAQITLDVLTEGETIYTSNEPVCIDTTMAKEAIMEYGVGSVLNTANGKALSVSKWNEVIHDIQHVAMKSHHKIPILYGIDAIHGATYTQGATMFPQQIAQAATWNPQLTEQLTKITACETRASGIPWVFSPVLDLGNDPRWARMWEGYGEDPYLTTAFGLAAIQGYQGGSIGNTERVGVCLKHFLGYTSDSGKDRTPANISDISLREYHLPAFKAAIEADAASVMVNSGLINGVPVHANKDVLTCLLKDELDFKGVVVTDWADIENLYHRDKVASNLKEAIKCAINAGVDMSMIPYNYKQYCNQLLELVEEGAVSIERLDDAVRRILNLKYKLGLFTENSNYVESMNKFGSQMFADVAYKSAAESITMLKNEQALLPLSVGTKILVAGPNGHSMRTLNGGWTYTWQGEKTDQFAQEYNTIYEALMNVFGEEQVQYVPGVQYKTPGDYHEEIVVDIEATVQAAKASDVIVLCLGENSYTEKPGDLHDLMISENQEKLALALAECGKPIILILNEGRPRIIKNIEPYVDAVLQIYLPGNFGGDALADVLSGTINPSGKLPYTYPMHSNSLVVYNHKPSEESKTFEGMYDYGGGFFPQYEFGYGLSYTQFEYANLSVMPTLFTNGEDVEIKVAVKNVGNVPGKEVVQLYTYDHCASITPDVKRLRRFKKVNLEPGETKMVNFSLSNIDLSFINNNGHRVTEPGLFDVIVGDQRIQLTYQE